MAEIRPSYVQEDSFLDTVAALPSEGRSSSEDDKGSHDEKGHDVARTVPATDPLDYVNVAGNFLENGKERPIETAFDIATRCISLEDDPTLEVYTLRMWVTGIALTCFAAVLGQIFYFRPQTEYITHTPNPPPLPTPPSRPPTPPPPPSRYFTDMVVYVSQLFLQILALIMGRAWHFILPKAEKGRFWRFLNPGPFNIKEHVAILIMSSTATSSALAISVFASEELFYNIEPNYGVAIFCLLGSQLFGYGMAGLMRSFVVYPTWIVFPSLIPQVNLFDALHRDTSDGTQKKRLKFFWIVFAVIFVWEWFPEYLAPTLTGISIFCLAKRDSPWFTRIFGGANGNEGLGMFSISTDWNYVGSAGGSLGALFTPFSTQISQYIGVALCCILFCAAYSQNIWNAQNFPFLSQLLYYENGTGYDQLLILDSTYNLNQTALDIQGIPWYSTSNAIYYVGSNLAIGATLTHVGIWYMPQIIQAWRQYRTGNQPDPHYQLMKVYKEVPMWWYGGVLVSSFAMAMATAYAGHSQLPWWALIVAFILALFLFPFVVIVFAVTGFNTNVQQLAQMLGAALVPGNPLANLYFTLYGANTVEQAIALTRDLKLGQYTKLPPRATFWCQSLGTVIGAILQLIIMQSIIASQRDLLLAVQGSNIWSGQLVQSYNSQAIAWGALAKSMYGPSRPYFIIPLSIVIGLFVPLPFWLGHKFFPKLKLNQVVTPIMMWCLGYLSVGINSSIMMTMLIAIFSQFYWRRYHATFFRKYNYLLSAGLDGGTEFMVFIASFAVLGAAGGAVPFPNWGLNPNPSNGLNLDYCLNLNI